MQVADINLGSSNSNPTNLVNLNNTLVFSADDLYHGRELWKSDGTMAGTVMITDIDTNPYIASNPDKFFALNNRVYFVATDGSNGRELWYTDGTAAGTAMMKDINPLALNSNPLNLMAINGMLLFSADNGINGRELYECDGTVSGTKMIADLNPGLPNSDPSNLINFNGTLNFNANNGTNGIEMFTYKPRNLGIGGVRNVEGRLRVFPNPAVNSVQIAPDGNRLSEIQEIQILDAFGKRVLSEILTGSDQRVDVSSLSAGLYLIGNSNASSRTYQRLIITK
jgi:ELWxxDGT repeat protein